MEKEKIIALIEGYGADKLTQDEEIAFFHWYSEASLEEFHQLLSQCKNLPGHLSYYQDIPEDFKARLQRDIRNFDPDGQPDNTRWMPSLQRFRWGWAAAAILILLGAGSYFLFFNKSQKQIALTQAQRFRNDVAPGKNGAVLTLADGKKIVLDSMAKGRISTQGNTTVLNSKGQLTYSALLEKPTEILSNTLTTDRGNQYQLILPDGSKVWLNAASSITYPTAFVGQERKVTITGEAYFEVTQNANMPFKVEVNNAEVQVLGTRFNIMAYENEAAVETTLLAGSVKITNAAAVAMLIPGQQAQLDRNGGRIKVINDADVDEAVAWKNGFFRFSRADLQMVMRQLSRWYDVEVSYEEKIPVLQFGGEMQRNLKLSQVLRGLEKSQVHFRIEGKKLIVMP